MSMKTTLLSTKYKIEEKGTNGKTLKIIAFTLNDGTMNILTNKEEKEFTFMNSKPEIIAKIGKMITHASKINGI